MAKLKLPDAAVFRAGRTARSWKRETSSVEIENEDGCLVLQFSLPSKGGGTTDVKVSVGRDGFAFLLSVMVSSARVFTMQKMATFLAAQMAGQDEYEKKMIQKGRKSVIEATDAAYNKAPAGRNHAERLTRDMVRELVEKLNKSDDKQPLQ